MAKDTQAGSKFDRLGYGVALIPTTLFILLLTLIPRLKNGNTISVSFAWIPSLGVNIAFLFDGLSLLFGLCREKPHSGWNAV